MSVAMIIYMVLTMIMLGCGIFAIGNFFETWKHEDNFSRLMMIVIYATTILGAYLLFGALSGYEIAITVNIG